MGRRKTSLRDRQPATLSVVLADVPERTQLRALRTEVSELRDAIAELDLEIEILRNTLEEFEAAYHSQLSLEHQILGHVEGLVRHLERWSELLGRKTNDGMGSRGRRLDHQRQNYLNHRAPKETPWHRPSKEEAIGAQDDEEIEEENDKISEEEELIVAPDCHERLKTAYRTLARRYHPDLARTEEERIRNSDLMARINELYRASDIDRLNLLVEQSKGAEIDDPDLEIEDQIELLRERLQWFQTVLDNLREERQDLERSATCEMMRNVDLARKQGRDLIEELRHDLLGRVGKAYKDVREAIKHLEISVSDYNRKNALVDDPRRRRSHSALERTFDPYADKKLVRLGLDQLSVTRLTGKARDLAMWLEEEGPSNPAILRLVLLAYVSEMSPFPLAGLETFEDIEARFAYLSRLDTCRLSFEEALVGADDLVEFGVKRATEKVVHLGLRFRSNALRDATPAALQALVVRRYFKEVLGVLGEHQHCSKCESSIFAIPLYRTRGIDDLRASVCPECGHTLNKYWMPKGKDVQAILNPAFLDYEIVSEWTFKLGVGSLSTQLVPVQLDAMTVGNLKRQIVEDLFLRHDVQIKPKNVQLAQDEKRVKERTPLTDMADQTFRVHLTPDAGVTDTEALEIIRHRVRTRFTS